MTGRSSTGISEKQEDTEGPVKTLRAFKRVQIPAGKTVNVELELTPKQLEWWDAQTNTMRTIAGNFDIMVGVILKMLNYK